MIDRRKFVASFGATALLPALSTGMGSPAGGSAEPSAGARARVTLNGDWERRMAGELYDVISVPSSQHPAGNYELRREFLLPRLTGGNRAFLHFDAITYFGRASVNGKELGTMGPYVPHEFECTAEVREGGNRVEVAIADLRPEPDGGGREELALGVNPGWEAYGGIIRDVYLEVRPPVFIENLAFAYNLSAGYTQAACHARVELSASRPSRGSVRVSLWRGKSEVARGEKEFQVGAGTGEAQVDFEVGTPALWSPAEPNLYELSAVLTAAEGVSDQRSCRTGFREVTTEGNRFLLNGEGVVLNGVCRHDMWKEQGFTLTRAQMEQDMRMIKGLGANFVRLVHYPHHRRIVELADELGLLVSEEPGYWGMDFRKMPAGRIELGYRIMEAVIRRDWNSPSVFAWLLGNECRFTAEYLRRGKDLCNRLDPIRRLVSAANSTSKEESKPIFEQAGMDFFDQHPYTYHLDEFEAEARYDGPSKPLTFTEWGGKAIGQSQIVMQNTVDRLLDLVEAGLLSGHVFWSWQDMRQYSRIDWEMQDGILESGVVTEGREPRDVVYLELARLFTGRRHETEPADAFPQIMPLSRCPWSPKGTFQTVDLQKVVDRPEGQENWASFEAAMAKYWTRTAMAGDQWKRTGSKFRWWQGSELRIAGAAFRVPVVDGYARPLLLTPEAPEVSIPLDLECVRLHILGHATLAGGYPAAGTRGEVVGAYTLRYASGKTRDVPLRNGYEVAQSNLIDDATRIDPEALDAPRALLFVKDLAREHYQILLYSIPTGGGRVSSLELKLKGEQAIFPIFAVLAEKA